MEYIKEEYILKKKIIAILIAIILIIIILVTTIKITNTKEAKSDLTTIRLAEVTHSVFYAPLYIAIENGYFEDEGIEIELILTPGADKVSAAVLSNTVDVGFAGTESSIYVYAGGESDYLVTFAGLTKRDGQFILARDCSSEFSLEDLYGREILVGRAGGMPAVNFLNAMKNAGVDIDKINVNFSIDFASLSGTFIGGVGDYVNLFEPTATTVVNVSDACIVDSIGRLSGEVPYTAFYARKSYIENNEELLIGFTKAIAKGLDYIKENDSNTIASVILPQFPDSALNDIITIIDNYKKYDSWLSTPYITESSFNNLQDMLIDNDLLEDYVPYSDLINNLYE